MSTDFSDNRAAQVSEVGYKAPAWVRLWAQIISIVFHPLFIMPYMYILLAQVNPQLFGKPNLTMFWASEHFGIFFRIMLTMVGLPLLAIGLMRALNMISHITVPDRQERIGPYIVVGLSYIVSFVQVNSLYFIPLHIKIFILGATMALFTAFIINLFSKISIHAVGMGGMLAMVMMSVLSVAYNYETNLHVLPFAVLVAGLVGTARRVLGAHEAGDVYGGYFVGFFAQFVALQFLYVV